MPRVINFGEAVKMKVIGLFLIIWLFVPLFLLCKKEEKREIIRQEKPLRIEKRIEEKKPLADEELKILFFSPKGEIEYFKMGSIIFSEPVVPLSEGGEFEEAVNLNISPPIKIKKRFLGTKTLAFFTEEPLPNATRFKVTIPQGTKSLSGKTLKSPLTYEFSTPQPELINSFPPPKEKNLGRKPSIYLVFNQRLKDSIKDKIKMWIINEKNEIPSYIETIKAGKLKKFLFEKFRLKKKETLRKMEGRVFELKPLKPLPLSTMFGIKIDKGVESIEGTIRSQKEYNLNYETHNPFYVNSYNCLYDCSPEYYRIVEISFSTPVNSSSFKKSLKVNPEVKNLSTDCWYENKCDIGGNFEPDKSYTFAVSPDLKDQFQQRLGKIYSFSIKTNHFSKTLSLLKKEMVVEKKLEDKKIAMSIRNIFTPILRFFKLTPLEMVSLYNKVDFSPSHIDIMEGKKPDFLKNFSFGKFFDQIINSAINLNDILSKSGNSGLFYIDLSSSEYVVNVGKYKIYERGFLNVTDLGISAKLSADKTLIWVTDLKNGAPVSSANVSFFSNTNKKIWNGVTDDNGIAVMDVNKEKIWQNIEDQPSSATPFIFAEKQGDISYLSLTHSTEFEPYEFGLSSLYENERFQGFIFTDKDIYKKGEKVHLKGFVRKQDGGLKIPEGINLNVEVINPYNEIFKNFRLTLNKFGSFNVDIPTDDNSPYGTYRIVVKIEGKDVEFQRYFRITIYHTPKFNVSVKSPKESYIRGETIKAEIKGKYYFGVPMSDAPLHYTLFSDPIDYAPPFKDDYVFSLNIEESDTIKFGGEESILKTQSNFLNEDGIFEIKHPGKMKMNRPQELTIEAIVKDMDGSEISGRKKVIIHPASFYIGLKEDRSLLKKGENFNVQVISVDIDGKLIKSIPVHIELYRREWRSVKKKGMIYDYRTEIVDKKIQSCEVISDETPKTCTFKGDAPGYYVVFASAMDENKNRTYTNLDLYIYGEEYAPWKMRNDDIIELVPDKKIYRNGDVAKILVKSPFNEGEMLITTERESVIDHKVMKLENNSQVIEIPIQDKHIPNFYVSVILRRGRVADNLSEDGEDVGSPAFKIGYTKIKVDSSEKKLGIQIDLQKEKFVPQEELTLKLKLKDSFNKGVKGEITLMVIDEAVLNLTAMKTPDPYSYFYEEKGLGITTYNGMKNVIGILNLKEKGGNLGGDGDEEEGGGVLYRKDFIDVAYYNPSIETDNKGNAEVQFKLPDNLTTFRIIALANAGDDLFGSSEKFISTYKPLMITTTQPYFVEIGDEFKFSASLFNQTEIDGKVSVSVKTSDIFEVKGKDKKWRELPKGEKGIFEFEMKAIKKGNGKIAVKAKLQEFRDAVEKQIPVIVRAPLQTFSTYGESSQNHREYLKVPENIMKEEGGLKVRLSSSGLNGVSDELKNLIEYPYGCIEQLSSKLLALINIIKFIDLFGKITEGRERAEKYSEEAIRKILSLQDYEGGFRFWQGSEKPDIYASAYATYVLYLAKKSGLDIREDVLQKAKEYLKNSLSSENEKLFNNRNDFNSVRAFVLYVLSHMGDIDEGYIQKLWEEKDGLPSFAKAFLADSLWKTKKRDEDARFLIDEILKNVVLTAEDAYIEEVENEGLRKLMSSDLRTNAIILRTLLDINPSHPLGYKILRYLLKNKKHRGFTNTQEGAWILLSFMDYYKEKEKIPPDYKISSFIDNNKFMEAEFRGRTLKIEEKFIPITELIEGKNYAIDFQKDKEGIFYYNIDFSFAKSLKNIQPLDNGFMLLRRFLSMRDKKEIRSAKVGDIVLSEVIVITPQNRFYVVVEDNLGAGLEGVDFRFETESEALERKYSEIIENEEKKESEGVDFYTLSYISSYSEKEITDRSIQYFIDYMGGGIYKYISMLRAKTKGKFYVPPPVAFEMYKSENYGSGEGAMFEVK